MRIPTRLLLLAASTTLAACASTPDPSSLSAQPSLSSMATSTPAPSSPISSYAIQTSHLPTQIQIEADLIIPPDQACLPVGITALHTDLDSALAAAKAALADVTTRTGGTVRIDDLRSDVIEPEGVVHHRVIVRAVVEQELADEDVFARAAVVAHLADSLRTLLPPHPSRVRKNDDAAPKVPLVTFALGTVEPGLKNIEQHRQRLLDGWAARINAMSKSVGGNEVDLTSCQAPPAVQVRGGTFERFGVSLPISCSIAIKAKV